MNDKKTESYRYPEADSPLRPDACTQSEFKKKKAPVTYRYDSSLSPVFEWDGGNGARVLGLADAVEQLKALEKPFLPGTGNAERLSTAGIIATLKGHRKPEEVQLDFFGDPQHSISDHVQCIYMDPPYGVKLGSNFQSFVRKRDVKHNDDADMTLELEMVKAYRDTWELGLHSYLTADSKMGVPRPRNDDGAAHPRRNPAGPSGGALGRVGLSPSCAPPSESLGRLPPQTCCAATPRPAGLSAFRRFAASTPAAQGVSASPAEVRVGSRSAVADRASRH